MTTKTTAGFIAKCSAGHVTRYGRDWWIANRRTYGTTRFGHVACHCGCAAVGKPIKATVTAKVCDGRCTGAVGPACDCSCGGENHGAAHALVAA